RWAPPRSGGRAAGTSADRRRSAAAPVSPPVPGGAGGAPPASGAASITVTVPSEVMITPSGWDLIRFTEANAGSDGRPWATAVPRRSPAAERALPAAPRPPPAAVTGTGAIGHGSRGARCRPKRVPARPDAEGSPREEGRSRDGAPRKGWRHGPGFPAPAQPFAGPRLDGAACRGGLRPRARHR